MSQAFAYHRAVAPMMWVFVCVASVELVVVHLLVALWRPGVAMALSAVTLASVVWLMRVIASFRRLPVVIEADRLVMRVGTLRRVDVPRAQVTRLRDSWDAAALKQPGVVKLSLIAWPNVVVDIDPPLAGRWRVTAVAHRLDDPAGFGDALATWLDAPEATEARVTPDDRRALAGGDMASERPAWHGPMP